MDALIEEARKAISRVKERSIGPDTAHDLSALLDAALTELQATQGALRNLQSAYTGERIHTENAVNDARRAVDVAARERDDAVAIEQAHGALLDLAIRLHDTVAALDETHAQQTEAMAALVELRAQHTAEVEKADTARVVIEQERDHARTQAAEHRAALEQIAGLDWWNRTKSAHIARTAVHGAQ